MEEEPNLSEPFPVWASVLTFVITVVFIYGAASWIRSLIR